MPPEPTENRATAPEPEPGPELNRMRLVDFARERTTMCAAPVDFSAVTLDTMLHRVYGSLAEQIDIRAVQLWAKVMRRRMRSSSLLLFKTDLLDRSAQAVNDLDNDELEALPPLPEDTILGLEYPRMISVESYAPAAEVDPALRHRAMSIIVPFSSRDMPVLPPPDGEHFVAYVSYVRLADQRLLVDRAVTEERESLHQLSANRQVWMPSMVGDVDIPVHNDRISLAHLLRAALARGSEPRTTVIPITMRREGEKAGVKRSRMRDVRAVELVSGDIAPPSKSTDAEPAWKIQVSFKVKSHDRHYRDEQGNIVKTVKVKSYTKGKGLPPKAPSTEVTVARDPDSPRRTYVADESPQ